MLEAIVFQITWKLFQTRWNLNRHAKDDHASYFWQIRHLMHFFAFPDDATVRIKPKDGKKDR